MRFTNIEGRGDESRGSGATFFHWTIFGTYNGPMLPSLLGLAVLLAYIFTAGPTFYWLDSSELTAAAWGLGVAHPPGHPLASLLSRLVCLLPVGSIAFRVTLASALQAAGATALTAVLSSQLLSRLGRANPQHRPPRWVAPLASSAAALCVGLSYALWFQAVRAEVYSLNLLLLLAGACLVLRWDATADRRPLLAAAMVCGLGLCNHHFLVLLAIPAVLLFLLLRKLRRGAGGGRLVVGLVLAGALGLSALAYLPLRAAQNPQVNWGSPSTAERFWWVVTAKAFHKAVDKAAKETVAHRTGGAVFAVVGGLGPLGAAMSLGGLYFLWRRRSTWRVALLLCGLAGMNLLSPLTVGFDPLNADAHGYLAVAVAFLAPGLAVFIAVLANAAARAGRQRAWLRTMGPAAMGLLGCAAVLYQGVTSLPRCDLRQHWAAEETARAVTRQPARALLISSYFETVFNVWALRAVADQRPDLALVHRGFLGMPGYVEDLGRHWPALLSAAQTWRRAAHLTVPELDRVARTRPVAVEYDTSVHQPVVRGLGPAGLLLAYRGRADARAKARHRRSVLRWQHAVGPAADLETRRTMTWTHYQLTWYSCQRGLRALARYHYQYAHKLAPRSRQLKELARGCGL